MKPRQHKACTASTAASRGRRSPPTVTEDGIASSELSEIDSESNLSRVEIAGGHNPCTLPLSTAPTVSTVSTNTSTPIITLHDDVSRPSTSVTSSSHKSRRYPKKQADLDAIELVSSEPLNSPSDSYTKPIDKLTDDSSNSNDTLSRMEEGHDYTKTEFVTTPKSKEPSQRSSHKSTEGRDAVIQILGTLDCMMTDFLYPVRNCKNELLPHNLNLRVEKIKVLVLPIVRIAKEEACYGVCNTNCYFCWQDMTTYFSYRNQGKSILYDEKRTVISSLVRPYVTPKDTIVLSHQTCMGIKLPEGQDFMFGIYKRPSFFKWFKDSYGPRLTFIIIFMIIAISILLVIYNLNYVGVVIGLIMYNMILTSIVLLVLFWSIRGGIIAYKKWKRKTDQWTLVIWKPSTKCYEDTPCV